MLSMRYLHSFMAGWEWGRHANLVCGTRKRGVSRVSPLAPPGGRGGRRSDRKTRTGAPPGPVFLWFSPGGLGKGPVGGGPGGRGGAQVGPENKNRRLSAPVLVAFSADSLENGLGEGAVVVVEDVVGIDIAVAVTIVHV